MRDLFTARIRWVRVNWLWPLAILALPGCALEVGGVAPPPTNVNQGDTPHSSAVFCDIEVDRHCASDTEINDVNNLRLAAGAEALVVGASSLKTLDYSQAAQDACGPNVPQLVTFNDPYPNGTAVCLNCSVLPAAADAAATCVAQCEDLTQPGVVPASPSVMADCQKRARVSINAAAPTFCFENACSEKGTVDQNFMSPRRNAEPVIWQNAQNAAPSGADNNTLTKNNTGTNAFDGGAVSQQKIEANDGYVEFVAAGISTRIAGLSSGDPALDLNVNAGDIAYGIDLFKDGCVYIFENGAQVSGPLKLGDPGNLCTVDGAFMTYSAGEKFRVSAKANADGSAEISYAVVTSSCTTEIACKPMYTSNTKAAYPLYADTSFRDDGAIIGEAVVVRIR